MGGCRLRNKAKTVENRAATGHRAIRHISRRKFGQRPLQTALVAAFRQTAESPRNAADAFCCNRNSPSARSAGKLTQDTCSPSSQTAYIRGWRERVTREHPTCYGVRLPGTIMNLRSILLACLASTQFRPSGSPAAGDHRRLTPQSRATPFHEFALDPLRMPRERAVDARARRAQSRRSRARGLRRARIREAPPLRRERLAVDARADQSAPSRRRVIARRDARRTRGGRGGRPASLRRPASLPWPGVRRAHCGIGPPSTAPNHDVSSRWPDVRAG